MRDEHNDPSSGANADATSDQTGTAGALRELHGKICGDIRSRQVWLSRQALWYEMRHLGLRRTNKPFPGASELHYPLADSIIEKLKPFYFNQLFATETVAQFVPKRPELRTLAGELG